MEDTRLANWGESFLAGIAGALALTAVHQAAIRVTTKAPRMEVVGERAIVKTAPALGRTPPPEPSLYRMALAGDLLANSAFYSLVACGRDARLWSRAVALGIGAGVGALGIGAGVGALVVPPRVGLGRPPRSWQRSNQLLTVSWYLLGALAAACTGECLRKSRTAAA